MTHSNTSFEDNFKSLSRRSWLRNVAIAATGAVMLLLVLNSCTKEQWDNVKGHVPGGGLGSTPDIWYNLKVTYKDKEGVSKVGWMAPTKDIYWGFYDFMVIREDFKSKFRLHPGEDGFEYLEIDDGYWLSLNYDGWAYRSNNEYNSVGWKIVDGKLYSNYSRWEGYPLGCRWNIKYQYYFVGVGLGDYNVLTNCELVPAQ